MNMEIEEMHKQRNKDASSDRILPNVIRQDAGKKSSMSWGSPFQKKIHFMHVLKLKGNYVVSFSFHQKVSSVVSIEVLKIVVMSVSKLFLGFESFSVLLEFRLIGEYFKQKRFSTFSVLKMFFYFYCTANIYSF